VLIPDVNVLIYAVNTADPHHPASRSWLEAALNGHERVGFDWVVLLGFVRISTHRSILPNPIATADAWDIVRGWVDRPISSVLVPDDAHLDRLAEIATRLGIGGNLVTDAHLASLAIGRRAQICSYDSDFDQIDGVIRITPAG
jgi:hypothetical protein